MAHPPIEELELFALFESVSDWVWTVVDGWDGKAQRTLGEQLIRAADSINANLVEGDGRYTLPDSLRFFIIGRASARETRLWIHRAMRRGLVSNDDGLAAIQRLESATRMLNQLITYRRSAKFVKESQTDYATS